MAQKDILKLLFVARDYSTNTVRAMWGPHQVFHFPLYSKERGSECTSQGFSRVLKGSQGFSRVLKGSQWFSRILKGFQGFYFWPSNAFGGDM